MSEKNMPYKIRWDVRAYKELKGIDNQIAITILNEISKLSNDDQSADIKRLEGKFKGKFRLRVGDYRVIYWANNNENTIYIIGVRHRRDAYRD
jgi:mRNA interferase RelE/StbE